MTLTQVVVAVALSSAAYLVFHAVRFVGWCRDVIRYFRRHPDMMIAYRRVERATGIPSSHLPSVLAALVRGKVLFASLAQQAESGSGEQHGLDAYSSTEAELRRLKRIPPPKILSSEAGRYKYVMSRAKKTRRQTKR